MISRYLAAFYFGANLAGFDPLGQNVGVDVGVREEARGVEDLPQRDLRYRTGRVSVTNGRE